MLGIFSGSRRLQRSVVTCSAVKGVSKSVSVSFTIPYHVNFGQHLAVVGSTDALGNWNPNSAVRMTWNEGDNWNATISLSEPPVTELEYKYVIMNGDGNIGLWKPGHNFKLDLVSAPGAHVKVLETWVDGPRHIEVDLSADDCSTTATCSESIDESTAQETSISAQSSSQSDASLSSDISSIQKGAEKAMGELRRAWEAQLRTLHESQDPCSIEVIRGDRVLAASNNKAIAFNRATKAAEMLPSLPGTSIKE